MYFAGKLVYLIVRASNQLAVRIICIFDGDENKQLVYLIHSKSSGADTEDNDQMGGRRFYRRSGVSEGDVQLTT